MSDFQNNTLDSEFSIEKYWEILKPRLHILLTVCVASVLAGIIYSFTVSPVFRATGTIMVEPENQNTVMFSDRLMVNRPTSEYFNTQMRILKSRTLARNVMLSLQSPDYISTVRTEGDKSSGREISQKKVTLFLNSLSVEPVSDTRLIRVSFSSSGPKRSSAIVNRLFEHFINFNRRIRSRTHKQSSKFIINQIDSLSGRLAEKERELSGYSSRKDLFFLSNEESTIVGKYSDLNRAYTEAQINRVNKESVYNELRRSKPDDFPEIRNNQVISNLKNSLSQLESDYSRKKEIYKETYPEMIQLKSQINNLEKRIAEETRAFASRALSHARNEFESSRKKEISLKNLLDKQKKEVVNSKSDAIYHKSLSIEVENMRNLQNYLERKYQESLLSSNIEGLNISNIKIIDKAEPPFQRIAPKRKRLVIIFFVFGAALGLLLVFFLDLVDSSVKDPEDLRKSLGLPALGMVLSSRSKGAYYGYIYPYIAGKNSAERQNRDIELVNFREPESALSECYRNIRTSILLSTPERPPKVIAVSSAKPSEGKTSTAVNLAVSFCQLGRKVLIIDCDLRKPRIHKIFGRKNTSGLSSFLVGRNKISEIINESEVEGLSVICSGPVPPNPVELLDSEIMSNMIKQLSSEEYDLILLDTPPYINIADPVILGKLAQGTILVTWHGKTSKKVLGRAVAKMRDFSIKNLGVVLNNMTLKKEYYTYEYNYSVKEGKDD